MSGLARLGHIARGINNGVQDFQQMQSADLNLQERKQRMGLNDIQLQRAQRQWAQQDTDDADMKAAMEAARRVLEEDAAAPQAGGLQAAPPQAMGATNPALIESAAGAPGYGASSATPPPQAPQGLAAARRGPNAKTMLRAAQAQADELFKRGRMDLGMKQWEQAEGVRSKLRSQAGQGVMTALASGGDVGAALKELDDLVDDGLDIESVKPVQGKDGKPAYEVRHRRRVSGQAVPEASIVTAQDLEMRVAKLLADPKETAKFAFQTYLANLKGDKTLEQVEARGENALELQDRKNEGAARTATIRASGTVTAAQIRKSAGGGKGGTANNVARTVTNADGTRTIIFRDGSNKTLADESGKPIIGIEAERLLQSLTKEIGKSREGERATPEANRARADELLPKPAGASGKRIKLDAQGNIIP
jgi:hypothetical protein